MSDSHLREQNSSNDTGEQSSRKSQTQKALSWLGNFVLWLVLFVTVGAGFFALLGTWIVSADQGTSFFDPTGWSFIGACIVALFLYDFDADDGYGGHPIRDWLKESFNFTPPVWWFNMVAPIIAAGVWGLFFLLQATPFEVRVQEGSFKVTTAGEILVEGQTFQGSRTESPIIRTYNRTLSVSRFPIRLPMNDTDYVVGYVSGSYQTDITPELRDIVRANPPSMEDENEAAVYFDRLFVRELAPAFAQLVRDEAAPGNTTIGDTSGWSADSASVPMAVRLGLRLEEAQYSFPTWIPEAEITHLSVGDWNRE
jgi:hypothetical protein